MAKKPTDQGLEDKRVGQSDAETKGQSDPPAPPDPDPDPAPEPPPTEL